MHRKTAFIQNQLSQAVADAIDDPDGVGQVDSMPEHLGGLPKTPEVKKAVNREVKNRNRRRGKKRA